MIRPATADDAEAILALNLEFEHFLSPMDAPRFARLSGQAAYLRVALVDGRVGAFLMAMRESADYDSPNYRWFADAYDSFLYVDRVVVAAVHQGRRLGSALYDDLFEFARRAGTARVACEFDVDPPNEASRRFHARYGFDEVGTHSVGDGGKRVSLQVAAVAGSAGRGPQVQAR